MFVIDIDEVDAHESVARITGHLPVGATLGRVLAVSPAAILAEDALFGHDADDDCTWRLVEIGETLIEVTRWRDGVEIGRRVRRQRVR